MSDPDLNILYKYSMSALMKEKCKKFYFSEGITFFSDKEFEENKAVIFTITGAMRRLEEKLKKLDDEHK